MLERFLEIIEVKSQWAGYLFLGFMSFLLILMISALIIIALSPSKKIDKEKFIKLSKKIFIVVALVVIACSLSTKHKTVSELRESISLEKVKKTDGVLKVNNIIKKVIDKDFSESVYEAEYDGQKALVLTNNTDIKPSPDMKKEVYKINFNKDIMDKDYYQVVYNANKQIFEDLNGTVLIFEK